MDKSVWKGLCSLRVGGAASSVMEMRGGTSLDRGRWTRRDPSRCFTPQGRPMRKPRRIAMRLSSVSSAGDLESAFFLERPTQPAWKCMGLRECREARPPLRPDLAGPTPCTYSVRPLPLNHLGAKINPPSRYTRDALPSVNTQVWTHKVDVKGKTPNPCTYTSPNVLGRGCPAKPDAPAYSMTPRNIQPLSRARAEQEPAPNSYDRATSRDFTLQHFPAFTVGVRRNGQQSASCTPGPAHYFPNHSGHRYTSPAFTMRPRTTSSF